MDRADMVKAFKALERSPWFSKTWTAYALTLATLIALVYLGGDVETTRTLATAIAIGLPVLLGAQKWADAKTRPALAELVERQTDTRPAPPAGG